MRPGESRRVLLVDDHAAVRHGLTLVLTEECVGDCRETAGREEALVSSSSEPPALARAVRDVMEGWLLISLRAAEGFR